MHEIRCSVFFLVESGTEEGKCPLVDTVLIKHNIALIALLTIKCYYYNYYHLFQYEILPQY